MEKLISEINKKFNNEFSYLKIYDVEYSVSNKSCTFTFMYPENIANISNEDRKKINLFVNEYLNLNNNVIIKYKKSYLDKEFILKEILFFLKNSYSSIFAYISEKQINIKNNNCYINVVLDIAKNICDGVDIKKFEQSLSSYLFSKFCAEFFVCVNQTDYVEFEGAIEKNLEKALKSVTVEKLPRYKVVEPVMLVGKEFYFEPEYIGNVKTEKQSVIFAGKIVNINKKTFIKKGKVEKEKAYYTFGLNEGKAQISVVYFCPKANEVKMDKLVAGDTICVMGDVRNGYNGSLTLYAKNIALCELPENIYEVKEEKKIVLPTEYRVVKPERVLSLEQENIFEKNIIYNKYIYDNNFVVFDVETTGLDAESCEIIEIGASKIENGKICQKFQTLVKPTESISKLITDLTGIDNKMVENAPSIKDVIKDFYHFCENSVLVGYNVSFDMKFIQNAGKNYGITFTNDVEDAMVLAREKVRLSNYKLKTVVKELNIVLENAHRAYNDALATAKVFLKLNEL